jgi:hypothetical protein
MLAIIFGSQFALLHYLASTYKLYWRYDWLDLVMHAWGGLVLAFIYLALRDMRVFPKGFKVSPRGLLITLLCILIAWEIFGVYLIGGFKEDYLIDTSLDLTFGILGAILGYRLGQRLTLLD